MSYVITTSKASNESRPAGRNCGTGMDVVPYRIDASPWTSRISPTVPTIFSAARWGASLAANRSMARPSSGPSPNTLIASASFQSSPLSTWSQ